MSDLPTTDEASATLPCVLFLDDDERILRTLQSLFRRKYDVLTTNDANKAIEHLSQRQIHLVVCDQRMPEMTGVEFLRKAKEISPNSTRVLLTAYPDLNPIIGAINDGEIFGFTSVR